MVPRDRLRVARALMILSVVLGFAVGQYVREWQSPNLGIYGWGGSYGYDIDGDGAPNLWTRSESGQIVVYNSSLAPWWTVTFPGYENGWLATPRDIDGDGLVEPVNMDGDGAGEVVFSGAHYTADGYTGKIRVYDAASRQLEWESGALAGFSGTSYVDDVDNDGKHEVIIIRTDYTGGWGYVEVYGYAGAGVDDPGGWRVEFGDGIRRPTSPAAAETSVRFRMDAMGRASLTVSDCLGREVSRPLDEVLPAGEHTASWDGTGGSGRPAPAGTYFYRLETPTASTAGRFVLVR